MGILRIRGRSYNLEPVPLKTVRPFYIKEVYLNQQPGLEPNSQEDVIEYLSSEVHNLIEQNNVYYNSHPELQPMKPLIRLRVEYTGFNPVNTQRFGQPFLDLVANPKELLQFFRKRVSHVPSGKF